MLKRNRYFVETSDATVFEILKSDPTIAAARTSDEGARPLKSSPSLVNLLLWFSQYHEK